MLTVEFAKRFFHLHHCRLILSAWARRKSNEDHRSPLSVQSSQSIPTVSGLCRDDRTAFAGVRFWGVKRTSRLALHMSAYDPKRTSRAGPRIRNVGPVDAALTIDRRGLCPRWIEGVRCAVALSVGLCR